MNSSRVVVFGSLNMDLVTQVPCLPVAGETLTGDTFSTVPGGKGANQAIALARLGTPTTMIGRVGGDSFGQTLIASLQRNGVQTDGVIVDNTCTSGVALIAVDRRGENHIIVVPGANGRLDASDVQRLESVLAGAALLLLQLEVPLPVVQAAAQAARDRAVPVLLDPAPACVLPPQLYPLIDLITPNAIEAERLVGFPVPDPAAAARAAEVLRQRGVGTVIITLGHQGVYCATAEDAFFIPAFAVTAVDTVAAGDAFNGALAAALSRRLSLKKALLWANAAGALSVTQAGAQPSLPDENYLRSFLIERGKAEALSSE